MLWTASDRAADFRVGPAPFFVLSSRAGADLPRVSMDDRPWRLWYDWEELRIVGKRRRQWEACSIKWSGAVFSLFCSG